MFSGKSTELLRRLSRMKIAGKRVALVKHAIDNRFDDDRTGHVCTHSRQSERPTHITSSLVALLEKEEELLEQYDVIGVDEGQFFDADDLDVFIRRVLHSDRVVIVAALDGDYRQNPFEHICRLCAIATKFDKLYAVCLQCGSDAPFSFRKTTSASSRILVGADDAYEARCWKCLQDDTMAAHE